MKPRNGKQAKLLFAVRVKVSVVKWLRWWTSEPNFPGSKPVHTTLFNHHPYFNNSNNIVFQSYMSLIEGILYNNFRSPCLSTNAKYHQSTIVVFYYVYILKKIDD